MQRSFVRERGRLPWPNYDSSFYCSGEVAGLREAVPEEYRYPSKRQCRFSLKNQLHAAFEPGCPLVLVFRPGHELLRITFVDGCFGELLHALQLFF